tara:strand:- start:4702 stop:5490 length:789 start_codon:yes stop_codon:yes gene_type:complete
VLKLFDKMDFTIKKYCELLDAILTNDYSFQTFNDFLLKPKDKVVILRHDVDKKPINSLKIAEIEYSLNIKASYYFRSVPDSWDEVVIKEIASLGHEIGYHYENLSHFKGDMHKAIENFQENLAKLRKLSNVSTICMHGSPLSKYDSKDLWKEYNYKDFNIIGEPYFDIDFNKVFYLTDTGRMWDGYKYSIRDKIDSRQLDWIEKKLLFHKTDDIIKAINSGNFPSQVMISSHPQRWSSNKFEWYRELFSQNVKNIIKKFLSI